MILIDNQTSYKINKNILEKIKNFLNINKDIEVLIVNNTKIKKLNKKYRGIEKSTDVLSFPLEDIKHMPLGSIVISINKAKEAANQYAHSLDDEIALLFIHGLLHLLGYDHEIDNGQMRKKEEEVIKFFNLPASLIIRNSKE